MKIEILGGGCAKCETLSRNAVSAAEQLGIEYELIKVKDLNSIMAYGVMVTPALVINGKVISSGTVLTLEQILPHLK